jgi:hypothetical protein
MSAQGYYEDQLEEAIGNLFRYYHTGGGVLDRCGNEAIVMQNTSSREA